ncbi:helix-turn-helix domain-containing protein [Roseateles sp. P5_E4]
MHSELISRSGMALRSRHERAGRALATPLDHHRVVLHLSASTKTACLRTGLPFLRTRGDVDIVPAGAADGFEAQSDFNSLEVLIAPSRLERMADELGLGSRHVEVGMVHMAREPRLQGLLYALAQDLQSDAPFGEHFRNGLVQSVATAVLLRAPSSPEAPAAPALQRVQDYIEANLERPLSLPSLARVAGVSPWSLQRLFRSGVGMPVHRYVVSRRVERARQLVQQRAGALSEIALMAGFAHQSHMSRWMRRLPE